MYKKINVLSLYDGISCGRTALEKAGFIIRKYYASEIDKYAMQITQSNFPDTIQLGDALKIDFNTLLDKDIDIIIAGSPCTNWSVAKKNREISLDGIGGQLFGQFKKAIDILKPKYFLLENVKSMHNDVRDAISKELGVEPIMINSALVSAQQRKRYYWTNIPNITQPKDCNIKLSDILEIEGTPWSEKSHCLTANYNGACFPHDFLRSQRTMIPVLCKNDDTITKRCFSVKDKMIALNIKSEIKFCKMNIPDGEYYMRKLTPVECERLQTLKDGYTSSVATTNRYKALGNGWTVDVIAHILSHIPADQ